MSHKYRLMVVEDDQRIADLVSRTAVDAGFITHRVTKSAHIMTLYNQFAPDVLVLDIFMPDMDGFEVLEWLKSRASDISIILISGQDAYRNMALKLGLDQGLNIVGNISKPFRVHQLRMELEKVKSSLPSAASMKLHKNQSIDTPAG